LRAPSLTAQLLIANSKKTRNKDLRTAEIKRFLGCVVLTTKFKRFIFAATLQKIQVKLGLVSLQYVGSKISQYFGV